MVESSDVGTVERISAAAMTSAGSVEGPARDGDLSIELRGIEPVPESKRYGSPMRLGTLWFGTQISASMFMVGSLGPAFVSGTLEHLWVYLIAPPAGAALAVLACRCIHRSNCCGAPTTEEPEP